MRHVLMALFLLSFASTFAQTLEELEKKSAEKPAEFDQVLENERFLHAGVLSLIERDALQTPSQFLRAGQLQLGANEKKEETLATGYQLLLTALAMGEPKAAESIGKAWDGLLMATGRYRRIGVMKMPMKIEKGDQWWIDPAPAAVRTVLLNPTEAQNRAKTQENNAEVQKIVDDDQKARADWSHLTREQLMKIMADDRARFARIKRITNSGGLKTSLDFWNAALVCQHGQSFLDYALAHELSVCSMILGKKDASWLAGASYDRMLLSASYPQAFDTQYFGNWKLQQFSPIGINDRMRVAVVHLTLAQSQDREKHPPK